MMCCLAFSLTRPEPKRLCWRVISPIPPIPPIRRRTQHPASASTSSRNFLPFLREQLAQRLIVDTLSAAAGLLGDVTNLLLSEILQVGTPAQSAMKALEKIKNQPPGAPSSWKGYLIPSANAAYTFVGTGDTQPASLLIGGQPVPLAHEDAPSNACSGEPERWSSDPVKLKSGSLYLLEVTDRTADQLKWKTPISPLAPIPSSALLPDYSSQGTTDAFTKLAKAAIIVNGFNLSADEASYFQNHAADFDSFDFNAVPCSAGSACRPIPTFATICPGQTPGSSTYSNGRPSRMPPTSSIKSPRRRLGRAIILPS